MQQLPVCDAWRHAPVAADGVASLLVAAGGLVPLQPQPSLSRTAGPLCTQNIAVKIPKIWVCGTRVCACVCWRPACCREQLATYTLGHNQFSGSWALALSQVRILEYLDISHNHLTGVLPPQITLLTSLKSLKLANNMFSGTITEDLYYLPALSVVELSSNQFVGTTPVSIG